MRNVFKKYRSALVALKKRDFDSFAAVALVKMERRQSAGKKQVAELALHDLSVCAIARSIV